MIYYLVAVAVILIDQFSKWAIVNYMKLYESIPLIEGWLHITSSRNRGAAFGILQNQRWFFISLTVIVVVFLVYYIYRVHKTQKLYAFALALILGGAIGNLIDRASTGQVVDFIDVRIINFAIFNLADSAIVIGVGLLLIDTLFTKEDKKIIL
ncbi:signal peptidase II [Vulcanibacillus modesticaldus]|uniref:Lipoprotein signal peptidase n=1 Tax=Vulcanibacillus modesticaldus TaxID=337097 RepID=A0A1D2YTU4_9BACI|nr:signal peptidase II [Vulcanibacillus modesticaldus]OEF99107.1 signal peptidase II [Vulcanibacillus modesticaldus]